MAIVDHVERYKHPLRERRSIRIIRKVVKVTVPRESIRETK
jgi:hypothetical protein